jgi:hypothetical protein
MFMEEGFDCVESGGPELLEDAKAKGLSAGRLDAVEDSMGASALDPFRVARWSLAKARDGLLDAGETFCAFEAFGKSEVGELHGD